MLLLQQSCLFARLPHTTTPVSYTHLDVYKRQGYKVVLTRSDDTVPADENSRSVKVEDLRNRVKLITDTNPVMTISIHQNSFPDASVSGPQVFYFEQSAESSVIASVMQDTLNNSLNPPKPRVCKSNNDYYICHLYTSRCV